jgi:hypothetical protein
MTGHAKRRATVLIWLAMLVVLGLVWLRSHAVTNFALDLARSDVSWERAAGRGMLRVVIAVTRGEGQNRAFWQLASLTATDGALPHEEVLKTALSYLHYAKKHGPGEHSVWPDVAPSLVLSPCIARDDWGEVERLVLSFQDQFPELRASEVLNSRLLRAYGRLGRDDDLLSVFQQRFVATGAAPVYRLAFEVLGAEFWRLARAEAQKHPDTPLGREFALALLTRPGLPEMKRAGAKSVIPINWSGKLGKWIVGLRSVPDDVPLPAERCPPPESVSPSEEEFPLALVDRKTGTISRVLDSRGRSVSARHARVNDKNGLLYLAWRAGGVAYWAYDWDTKQLRPITQEEWEPYPAP